MAKKRDEGSERDVDVVSERRDLGQPTLLGKATPLVGRKREFTTLIATLEECVEEHSARAVLVVAPPGLGKSRLLREFWQYLAEQDSPLEIWAARGDPMHADSPLGSLAQALRWTANTHEDEPLATQRDKLRERVSRSVSSDDAARVTAFLGELMYMPNSYASDAELEAARSTGRLMSDRVLGACAQLVAADSERSPVVFILEDVQWSDHATIGFLDRVLRDLVERPLMILALGRPEIQHRFPELWAAHDVIEMRLRPLSARASEHLVRAVFDSDQSIDDEQVARLVRRADGNPLILEELVRSAAAGDWAFPETVISMLHARLERLSPEAQRVARAACIFGDRFWQGGVAAVIAEAAEAAETAEAADIAENIDIGARLHELCAAEIIERTYVSALTGEAEYWFRHDLLRQAAYVMSTDAERVLAHRAAGQWLTRAGASHSRVVAEHLERGGALVEAMPFFVRAARDALSASDFEVAVALAERVAVNAQGQILGQLRAVQAEAHIWQQELVPAVECGEEALELLARGSRAWYEVAETVSWAQTRLGRGASLDTRAAALADGPPVGHDREGWLILAASLSRWLFIDGRIGPGRELLSVVDSHLVDAEGAHLALDPAVHARVHAARALRAAMIDDDLAESLREARASAEFYQEAGDMCRACLRDISTSYVQLELGLYAEATVLLRRTMDTANALGLEYLEDSALQNASVALLHQGSLEEARELAAKAAQSFEWREDARGAASCRLSLALAWLMDGQPDRADAEAHAALEWSPDGTPRRVWALSVLARIELARGRPAAALDLTTRGLALVDQIGKLERGETELHLAHIEALEALGRRDDARTMLRQANARVRARAALIDLDDWRESYLFNVPAHARIIELAGHWA